MIALETTWRRPRPWLAFGLVMTPFLLMFGLAPAVSLGAAAGLGGLAVWIASIVGAWAGVQRLNRGTRAEVRIDEDGVNLGPERVPRANIRSAYHVPRTDTANGYVSLLGEGQTVIANVDVGDDEQADRILGVLGLGATQHTAQFGVIAPWKSASGITQLLMLFGGLGLFTVSLPLHLGWLAFVGMATAIGGPILLTNATVHVGADGLLLAHRLGKRFLPWAEVEAVDPYDRGVVVKLRGEEVTIPLTARAKLHYEYERAAQAALIVRAREAFAAYRRGDVAEVAALLSRRGRPVEQWIRGLLDRDGDFRAAPIPEDRLWQVVESAAATPSARAGAAAVLARGAEEQNRARLRIAAEACASPRLRVVLEKAASGAPEAEVQAALAEVEDEAAEELTSAAAAGRRS